MFPLVLLQAKVVGVKFTEEQLSFYGFPLVLLQAKVVGGDVGTIDVHPPQKFPLVLLQAKVVGVKKRPRVGDYRVSFH